MSDSAAERPYALLPPSGCTSKGLTLSVDLPAWQKSLTPLVDEARAALDADIG